MKSGLFNDEPLKNFLHKVLAKFNYEVKRKVVIATANVNTGVYTTFDETMSKEEVALAPLFSSSIPAVFPHRIYEDATFMDGGTIWNLNVESAINKCKSTGLATDESKIEIDILQCSSSKIADLNHNSTNAISNMLRARAIKSYHWA